MGFPGDGEAVVRRCSSGRCALVGRVRRLEARVASLEAQLALGVAVEHGPGFASLSPIHLEKVAHVEDDPGVLHPVLVQKALRPPVPRRRGRAKISLSTASSAMEDLAESWRRKS